MSLANLANLVKTNQLKIESFEQTEFNGLIKSGKISLKDANNTTLQLENRFLLAYKAAHSFALAALRWHGYRSTNRYTVFQVLPNTLGVGMEVWRILAKCHALRNVAEYEGYFEIDEQLLGDLLTATHVLLERVTSLAIHTP